MTKEEYINAIVKLLKKCNDEKILYYIQSLLKEMS